MVVILTEQPLTEKESRWLAMVLGPQIGRFKFVAAVAQDIGYKAKDKEWRAALVANADRVASEVADARVVLALGKYAFAAVGGVVKTFSAWRCSLVDQGARVVIPFDSIWVAISARPALQSDLIAMLQRALDLEQGVVPQWQWLPEILFPTEEALAVLRQIGADGLPVSVDIENRFDGRITAIGICNRLRGVCLPWHRYAWSEASVSGIDDYGIIGAECKAAMISLIQGELPKVCQNGQHDAVYLRRAGVDLANWRYDTMLMHSQLCYPLPHDLQYIVASLFPVNPWKAEHKAATAAVSGDFDAYNDMPEVSLRRYCLRDCYGTIRAFEELAKRVLVDNQSVAQYELMQAKAIMCMEMRYEGIEIDTTAVDAHRMVADGKLAELAERLKRVVHRVGYYEWLSGKVPNWRKSWGEQTPDAIETRQPFNADSPKQLGQVFYSLLGFPVTKRTAEGGASTNNVALAEIREYKDPPEARELVDIVLGIRKQGKVIGTYINNMPAKRIHPIFKPNGAVTGRLAAGMEGDGYSIQTIPKPLRNCFVAPEGCKLISVDYKALEMRIIAWLAGDELLIEAFRSEADIHRVNAAAIFGVATPTDAQRELAKLVYAFNYGAAWLGVWERYAAKGILIPQQMVKFVHTEWFRVHHWLRAFQQMTLERARRDMYQTLPLSGRKIRYYGDPGKIQVTDSANHPVQGTGADIIDVAWRAVCDEIGWKDPKRKILIQNHDELVMVSRESEVLDNARLLVKHMKQTHTYEGRTMCFDVDVKAGRSWAKMEKVSL